MIRKVLEGAKSKEEGKGKKKREGGGRNCKEE